MAREAVGGEGFDALPNERPADRCRDRKEQGALIDQRAVQSYSKAVEAARTILREVSLPVGIGVHTGPAWVGFVGGIQDVLDFTALGDAVNVASRLGSDAQAGEILMSAATGASAGLTTTDMDARSLELRGRSERLEVLAERVTQAG